MAIRIVHENGFSKPFVFCDHCDTPITDATDGNYQWQETPEGETGPLHFTHKECFTAFEQAHEGFWYTGELECLLFYLRNNLKMNWKRAKGLAKLMGSM